MIRRKTSAWYYNKGKTDIVLSSLGISIKRGDIVDLYAMKRDLHPVQVRYSERFGSIKEFVDKEQLVKLDGPPEKQPQFSMPLYTVADAPLPDRSRSIIEKDPNEKTFVEQLEEEFMLDVEEMDESEIARLNERFAQQVDLDGFVDDDFINSSDDD